MIWKQWIRNVMVRQAAEQLAPHTVDASSGASSPDATADVAIVVNENAEAGSILDRLVGVLRVHPQEFRLYRGNLEERRVILAQVGGDCELAARVTKAVIRAHRPQWVIAAGFSVGLQPQLQRNDLLMASRVVNVDGARLKIDIDASSREDNLFRVGTVLTMDRLPGDENQRRTLGDAHRADVADTASLGIARACREAGTCCLVIRVVRECLSDCTPSEIQHSSRQASFSARLGSLVGGTFRRPGTARDWLRHKQDALSASDCLADFLKIVISQWLPPRPSVDTSESPHSPNEDPA